MQDQIEEETRADLEALTPERVESAAENLAHFLAPTPVIHSPALSDLSGADVYLKLETLQPTRAFKVRGALNKISRLHEEVRAKGVITASAGNHGQGVAYAAHAFDIPAMVYVPANANPLKVEAMKRLGAEVVAIGETYNDAYLEALRAPLPDATFVHAFDDVDVIAGQGTVATELMHQLDGFDTVVVPVGGGGLISGIALYLKARRPDVKVVGVEPAGANALRRSLDAGTTVTLAEVDTIADGLAASQPGRITLEVARRHVDDILVVSDEEILEAIQIYFAREHILVEPAAAAALAGLLHRYHPTSGERVVMVVSGANVSEQTMLRALSGDRLLT